MLLFQRSTRSHIFEWHHHYFRRPLAVIRYFWGYYVSLNKNLQSALFSKVLSKFAIPFAVIHSINESLFFIIKMQLHPRILSRYSVFWRHQLPSIIPRILWLFYESTWNDSLCHKHCLYFTKLIAATHWGIQL